MNFISKYTIGFNIFFCVAFPYEIAEKTVSFFNKSENISFEYNINNSSNLKGDFSYRSYLTETNSAIVLNYQQTFPNSTFSQSVTNNKYLDQSSGSWFIIDQS